MAARCWSGRSPIVAAAPSGGWSAWPPTRSSTWPSYPAVKSQASLNDLIKEYPPALMAMFGIDAAKLDMTSAVGLPEQPDEPDRAAPAADGGHRVRGLHAGR